MPPKTRYFADPVLAYGEIAPHFDRLAGARHPYLQAVETQIAARISPGSLSLLDIGAGAGQRALRIAQSTGLKTITLLEPCAQMSRRAPAPAELWTLRAEQLNPGQPPAKGKTFDVITCLWNVLGHVRSQKARAQVLASLRELLSPCGVLFLDVNHRYNLRSYGILKTLLRFIRDQILPREANGDVTANWQIDDVSCSTYGHVFTDKEMRRLAASAGLRIQERIVVDYDTGQTCRFSFQGSLLYVLRPQVR